MINTTARLRSAHPDRVARFGKYALLAILTLVAMGVAYSPHYDWETNERYPYPTHMDEYVHWGYGQAVAAEESLAFREPFTGAPRGDGALESIHENGFWAILAALHQVTGIDWLLLIEFGPALIAGLFALCAFAVVERECGGGVWAAGLVAAIPTSARFLGPGFLVPGVFSLLFFLGALLIAFHFRGPLALLLVFLLISASWPHHRLGGFMATFTLLVYAAYNLPHEWRWSIGIFGVCLVPVLGVLGYYEVLVNMGFLRVPLLSPSLEHFTYAPSLLYAAAGLGALYILTRRGPALARQASILTFVAFCLVEFSIRLTAERDFLILYDRTVSAFMIGLVLLGGIGLQGIYAKGREALVALRFSKRVVVVATVVVSSTWLVVVGSVAATEARETPHGFIPRVLDDVYYNDLVWIRENLGPELDTGLAPGVTTMPLTIVAGKRSPYAIYPSSWEVPPGADAVYTTGGSDLTYAYNAEVDFIYSSEPLNSPFLKQVHPRVYLVLPEK